MHTFEHTVDVAAPIDHVWEFSTAPENWERATPSLSEFVVHDEFDEGMRLTATYAMLGRSQETDMDVSSVEPGTHMRTEFTSPGMTGVMDYRFEEIDGGSGTRVTQTCEYEFGDSLLERIIEPVASRYNKRQFRNSLVTTRSSSRPRSRPTPARRGLIGRRYPGAAGTGHRSCHLITADSHEQR